MMSSDGLDSYGLDEFNINQDWFNEYKSATPDPNEGDLSLNVPLNDEQNAIYSIPPTQESYGSEFSSRIPSSQISEFAEPSPYQQQQPAQFETLQRLQPYETAQPCSSGMSESQISHNQSSSQIPSSSMQQPMEHFSYIPYETSSYVNYIPTSSQQGLSYEVSPASQQPSIQQLDQPPGQQPNIRYDTEWLPSSQYQQISTQGSGPITYTVMSSASSSQPQTSNPPQMQVMDSSYVQPPQPSYIQDGNQVLLTQMQTIQRQDPPQIVQHQLQNIPQNSVDSISYQPQMIYQNGPSVPSQSIQVIDGCQYISQDASSQSSFQTVQVLSSNAPPTIQQQQQPMQQTPTTSVRVSTTTAPRSRAKPASRPNGKKKPMVGDIKVIEQKVQEQGKVEVQVSLETSDEISRLTSRLMEIQKLESENGGNYSNEKKDIEAKLLSLFLGQQAPPAPTSAVDTSLQSQNPPAAPKRTSSSSRSRPKKTVAQLKQEAAAQVQEVQQQQPQLSNQPNAFIQQPPPIVTPKAPPKRLPPTSKQPQPPNEVATDMNNITYSSMGQPQIIYQHSTTASTSYGQPASVSVHYTSNMKQVPMSGELISLPPGSIPFTTQPGQRIYVIQNTTKAETFDSIQAQPITTTVVPKETKPPPKRRRPPPKPKPPKGLPIHEFDSPTTSTPQQIILVPPVELAKKIAEKQKERTSNLSNYFESLKESLDHVDYVSPFKNLSDVVQRLLPFNFLREPDLSDEFLDKVDHEILRHTFYMNERKRHLETKVRNILYKEALSNQSTDPELCMLLALDNEYDERQLNNDRSLFEQNRDQYIYENGVPTFDANLDKNSIDEARAKLGPIKTRQLQYKYREFDPSIYLGNIEEALAMKSPYIGSRRTSFDLETTYDESLVDDTESVVSMEMKAYVDHHVFPMNSPPGISSLRMEIGQHIPTEVIKRIEPVKVEENRVNESFIHVIEPEASPPKALSTLNEQPMIMPTIEDVIPPIINGFYSKEALKSTNEALKTKEHEISQKIKISLRTKISQMTSKFVEEGEMLESKELSEEIDMKPMKNEKISPIKIRPFEQEVIIEDRPPISRNASVEDFNMANSKDKTVVKRSCYGLDLSDEDEDEEKKPSTSEAPVMPIKLKILKSALQKESENTPTRKEDKKRHEKRKEKHEKRRHKHREKENRTSNHNHLEHNLPIKEEISLEKPATIVPKLVIPRARLGINALTQPDQDLHVNDIKEESYSTKDQHMVPKLVIPKSHKRHLREHHKSKEEKAERKKKKKKHSQQNDGISMDDEKPKVPRIKIKFGGNEKKWAATVDSSPPRDVVMDHREDLVLSPDVPTALPVFTPPHTNTSSINTPPSDTFSNERNNGTPINFDMRARVQFSPCSDESDDEKRCRLSNLVLSRLKKQ